MSKKESNPGPSFKKPPAPPRPPGWQCVFVDDLSGIELDFRVVTSVGMRVHISHTKLLYDDRDQQVVIDWNFIAAIVERDGLHINVYQMSSGQWEGWVGVGYADYQIDVKGKTLIEAVKRSIVKRKYGEEVE